MSRDRGSTSVDGSDLFEGAGYRFGVSIDLRGPVGSTGYDFTEANAAMRWNSQSWQG
jgi:hypothetical protein